MGLINQYDTFISVSIPDFLELNEQIDLIKKLQVLGVDMIQTQGYKASPVNGSVIESAENSIKNLIELSKHTKTPIMASCVINFPALKSAFDNGASAVCAQSIEKLNSEVDMSMAIVKMVTSVAHRNSINKEIVRTQRELLLY